MAEIFVEQVIEWIHEPRWTWFNKPLFECNANKLIFQLSLDSSGAFGLAGLTSTQLWTRKAIYLTNEELILWKMHDFSHHKSNELISSEKLCQGYVYLTKL